MSNWIVIVLLYLVDMGLLGLIGGLGSAAEAFRRWGASASVREQGLSPSS
jgi:hypothetical protein